MRSIEILVNPAPRSLGAPMSGMHPTTRRQAREVLDLFIEGANVTAQVADTQATNVLRDLAHTIGILSKQPRGKGIVRFYDEPWELCIERMGSHASLSVYRGGHDPQIAVYNRLVPFLDLVTSARDALDAQVARLGGCVDAQGARNALNGPAAENDTFGAEHFAHSTVVLDHQRDASLSFAAELCLPVHKLDDQESTVERADLHALLFRGRMFAEVRGRSVDFGECHPFLVAERLVELAGSAFAAFERGILFNVRSEAMSTIVGLRLGHDASVALTLGSRSRTAKQAVYTFPALPLVDFLESVVAFGRGLSRTLVRRDRAQASNLRLSQFRRKVREVSDSVRELTRQDERVNPSPEPYRAFAESARNSLPGTTTGHRPARLRYVPRWQAIVPGLDLRATFLCGGRVIAAGGRELYCLERDQGDVLWRVPITRGASFVTPGGIARLDSEGLLSVHDFGTGEVTLQTRIEPRFGGPTVGAVVSGAGLPRLLIVTEGEHHWVAIDLTSGERRWRHAWGRGEPMSRLGAKAVRIKRIGKLAYVTSGDTALSAIDVLSGALVWRVRDRLRFRALPTLDHDLLFAVAGGMASLSALHAIDPYAGAARWRSAIPQALTACTVEGSPMVAGSTVAIAYRDGGQLRLAGYDRESGKHAWTSSPVAESGTSWLAVDDLFIGNTPGAELIALCSRTGALRYRRALTSHLEPDVPRRLEPVLRSGALFVPNSDVRVIRPSDGELLGTIGGTDLIPDLLRVDERCDVYLAEESGHLAAFSAQTKLSIAK
jgi:outer membrane protein assembly factor BamB